MNKLTRFKLAVAAFLILICQLSIVNSSAQTWMNIYLSDGSMTQIDISTIDSITYSVTTPGTLATITTTGVTGISGPSALSGGNITADGGSTISHRGVCWANTTNPTTANDTTLDGTGTGTGSYTSTLTGLSANTTYYVRAYAINSAGTAYGNEVSFTTGDIYTMGSGVTDIDGNFYPSIILGTQEWMQQNLRVSRFANGDSIKNETILPNWDTTTIGLWALYNNDNSYDIPYGKYYNWYAGTDSRNVCPTGWHVPSQSEWLTLSVGYIGIDADAYIEIGTSHWLSPNSGATNSSGFTAIPTGLFTGAGIVVFNTQTLWISTTVNPSNPNRYYAAGVEQYGYFTSALNTPKTQGAPIRCLKD